MSEKFEAFKAELIALCEKHDVLISSEEDSAYNALAVWDRGDSAPDDFGSMVDHTK